MLAAGAFGTGALLTSSGPATSAAAVQQGVGKLVPQTDASVPARDVTMIGASPGEEPGETWGVGIRNGASAIVRYTASDGWSLAGEPLDADGQPLAGFKLDQPEGFRFPYPSPLAGQMTPDGGGVLAGTVPKTGGSGTQQVLLVRAPGGAFTEAPALPAGMLGEGESLFGLNLAPAIAALEEPGGGAGALVAPADEGGGVVGAVLHWDGHSWTREPIEIPAKSSKGFQVLAIGASSPANAWLIARLSSEYAPGSVALFRRHPGSGAQATTWLPVTPKAGGEAGEPLSVPVEEGHVHKPFAIPSGYQSQILTATAEGVWIDGVRRDAQASTTMYFKPEGETAGSVLAAWCKLPAGAPESAPPCQYELPEPLPTADARSFAWANPSANGGFGERIVTGFPEGVSMRLQGSALEPVLSLGGSLAPADVGGTFGAAFASPQDGWLGQETLPVHLTTAPAPSRLAPWPVAFHAALLAVAPQPGAAVGALSSEALAVGDQGEVTRYKPGQGWLPESLLGPGGRRETPRLRAVAWPTPTRAYAVGDPAEGALDQMWLWRAETGLWEPDPAQPENFRGNLLGVAFDPNNPARGYVVGQDGVLLRYGKTWIQEPEAAIPPPARGANFTSIAFAGSEAIVAYRKLPDPSRDLYEGGLIVNDGSGWQVDQGAAAALGANVPWAVAGLPDGGAAFIASGSGEGTQIYEREAAGAPWQASATPFPAAAGTPGAIALFREGGALRAITSGTEPDTYAVESEPTPSLGQPPIFNQPYPVGSDPEHGVMRQTASGWSDEEHELSDVKEPPGGYAHYDTVYQPDPVASVLVDPSGGQGWAVGGAVEPEHPLLDTSDIYRYPAEPATAPVGVGSAQIGTKGEDALFAIAGGAQCSAPCANLANARIGPDVWLEHAMKVAGEVPHMRAFLYTGPRVTTGQTAGPATRAVPYKQELGRYAEILRASPIAYPAASPTDLNAPAADGGTEATFEEDFGELPYAPSECQGPGCQSAYYSFLSQPKGESGEGGSVLVIVLDSTGPVSGAQLKWLEEKLAYAKSREEKGRPAPVPAIVVGNADLNAEIAANEAAASEVTEVLVCGQRGACSHRKDVASAYFFDSPEQNVTLQLHAGGASIPSFGSGTLGYVSYQAEERSGFIGASGFMIAQVNMAKLETAINKAPVSVELIPNIGELAMEAQAGTLLRRSQAGLFVGLARRPRAGSRAASKQTQPETDPYIPVPSLCIGAACAAGLLPEATLISSKPKFGGFVEPNLVAEPHGREVLQNAKGEAIPDEPRNAKGELNPGDQFSENANGEPINERGEVLVVKQQEGLFCAYNPGTTDVTISAGGLSYTLPVTVQAGSVRQPCGTVPTDNPRVSTHAGAPVPPPAPAPAPAGPAPASSPPPLVPVPPPPAPVPAPPPPPSRPAPPAALPPPFFVAALAPVPATAIVPPPPPPAANPTPPSGTSAVTSPVEAAQKEEEEEEATESVSNQAVAYRAVEHEPSPAYILGVVALAAFAGASTRRRMRGGRRDMPIAPATLSTMRTQRRAAARRGRHF
ncbi:MAG TPA: hypothetical protein VNV42_11605 [Solirubrobacteraceae bacterium]|nr:hypothetical protein [Solirubrobacteraceae bacterium]